MSRRFALQCWSCYKQPAKLAALDPPVKLKTCKGCGTAKYCSKTCQTANWHEHRWTCSESWFAQWVSLIGDPESIHVAEVERNQGGAEGALFGSLMHGIPEGKALGHLIDCFRMRVEDEYVHEGEVSGLYAQEDPMPDFDTFLNLAEKRPGLLPAWWSAIKKRECKALARDKNGDHCIYHAVEKHDIQEAYNNNMMPMRLRMLGERIYNRRVGLF